MSQYCNICEGETVMDSYLLFQKNNKTYSLSVFSKEYVKLLEKKEIGINTSNETYVHVCTDCPNIQFEFWQNSNYKMLGEYLDGSVVDYLNEKIEETYL